MDVLRGAIYVIVSSLMFALAGAVIKIVSVGLSSDQIVFWRNVFSLGLLLPWVLYRGVAALRTPNIYLILFRALAVVASLYCYYFALSRMPLADAVILNFSSPLFVPLFGYLLFRFALDRRVLVAVVAGFIGVALVVKPGSGVFEPVALIALMAGVLGALAVVALWRMPGTEHPARIAFYFAFFGLLVTTPPALWRWQTPAVDDLLLLSLLGLFSTVAHLTFAYGCLIAPSDRVNTLNYTVVIFATFIGWWLWQETPDAMMICGTALIIAAGALVTRHR